MQQAGDKLYKSVARGGNKVDMSFSDDGVGFDGDDKGSDLSPDDAKRIGTEWIKKLYADYEKELASKPDDLKKLSAALTEAKGKVKASDDKDAKKFSLTHDTMVHYNGDVAQVSVVFGDLIDAGMDERQAAEFLDTFAPVNEQVQFGQWADEGGSLTRTEARSLADAYGLTRSTGPVIERAMNDKVITHPEQLAEVMEMSEIMHRIGGGNFSSAQSFAQALAYGSVAGLHRQAIFSKQTRANELLSIIAKDHPEMLANQVLPEFNTLDSDGFPPLRGVASLVEQAESVRKRLIDEAMTATSTYSNELEALRSVDDVLFWVSQSSKTGPSAALAAQQKIDRVRPVAQFDMVHYDGKVAPGGVVFEDLLMSGCNATQAAQFTDSFEPAIGFSDGGGRWASVQDSTGTYVSFVGVEGDVLAGPFDVACVPFDSSDGWITMPNGTHVKIGDGGTISAGPKGLVGQSKSALNKFPKGEAKKWGGDKKDASGSSKKTDDHQDGLKRLASAVAANDAKRGNRGGQQATAPSSQKHSPTSQPAQSEGDKKLAAAVAANMALVSLGTETKS